MDIMDAANNGQQQQESHRMNKSSKLKKQSKSSSSSDADSKPTCTNNDIANSCFENGTLNKNINSITNTGSQVGPMKKRRKFQVASSALNENNDTSSALSASVLENLNRSAPTAGSKSSDKVSCQGMKCEGDISDNRSCLQVSDGKENMGCQSNDRVQKVQKKVESKQADNNIAKLQQDSSKGGSVNPITKPKKKSTFQETVLRIMFLSGKPYSIKGLANATGTTSDALNYLLLSLLDKNLIMKKEVGKKVLYWANQDAKAKELSSLKVTLDEMNHARGELSELSQRHQSLLTELNLLEKEPLNDELDDVVKSLSEEVSGMNGRILMALSVKEKELTMRKNSSDSKLYDLQKCPKRMKVRINKLRDEWKARRDKCRDFVDQLSDAMEKKPKDVMKMLDVETDESVGAKLPPKHDTK